MFLLILSSVAIAAQPLRIALPPALGSVPVILAQEWGLFEAMGVDVEIVPLASEHDRRAVFWAGQLDALITDLTGALLLNNRRPGYGVITSTIYEPAEDNQTHVLLLAMPFARVSSLRDIVQRAQQGQLTVVVPPRSDLEFMMDALFEQNALTPPRHMYLGEDDLVENSKVFRLGFSKAGAAVFPQPYADYISNLVAPGLPTPFVMTGFDGITVPPTVVVFARHIVEEDPERVALFYEAIEMTIAQLNELPRDELIPLGWQLAADLFLPGQDPASLTEEQRAMASAALEAVIIPEFPPPSPVDPAVFGVIRDWARARGYLFGEAEFDQLVVAVPTR